MKSSSSQQLELSPSSQWEIIQGQGGIMEMSNPLLLSFSVFPQAPPSKDLFVNLYARETHLSPWGQDLGPQT